MDQNASSKRSEVRGLIRFSKESLSAFGLTLVFIVYVAQAFRIPSSSMEDSLLIGDQLLGLKFTYGSPVLPFTHLKFPGLKDPEPGEVIIFKTPSNNGKDYIKRCVAGPGQTVEIQGRTLIVDGNASELPPEGKHILRGHRGFSGIEHFAPYRVPSKGETYRPSELSIRDALFLKHIIHQEHPRSEVRLHLNLVLDGVSSNETKIIRTRSGVLSVSEIARHTQLDTLDNWVYIAEIAKQLRTSVDAQGSQIELHPKIFLDGNPVGEYTIQNDNYFMLGDNRDNSLDSRYWGVVNRKFVKAQALIVYFSMDPDVPFWNPLEKIRWDRSGMLIRST